MLERDIESWSSRKARATGWWNRKFTSPGNRSVPDRVFGKSWVFWTEFKATGKRLTELQLEEHKLMLAAGLRVYWTDCREGFAAILDLEEKGVGNSNGYVYDGPNSLIVVPYE